VTIVWHISRLVLSASGSVTVVIFLPRPSFPWYSRDTRKKGARKKGAFVLLVNSNKKLACYQQAEMTNVQSSDNGRTGNDLHVL
jgi:hypothetical protein